MPDEVVTTAEQTPPATVTRSISIALSVDDEYHRAVVDSIRRYRACCRQLYSALLMAQCAASDIEVRDDGIRVRPHNERAKIAMGVAMGAGTVTKAVEHIRGQGQNYTVNLGVKALYEFREYFFEALYPNAHAFVWDSCSRDVVVVWRSGDPEYPQASRGWLALQGARGPAQFNWRGIGFPRLTARPKLEGHTLTLNWDHDIGPVVFNLPRLNGGHYYIWKALRDGLPGWKLGTLYLNEKDHKLKVTLSHDRPATAAATVDPARVCQLRFTDESETFLRMLGPDGAASYDSWSAAAAVGRLVQLKVRRDELERRRAACGNPRRPWGHRRGWLENQDVLSNNTRQRDLMQKDYAHAWSRRTVSRLLQWRCGKIQVEAWPTATITLANGSTRVIPALFGHPWSWTQFNLFLKYKANEVGIEVLAPEPPTAAEPSPAG